MNNRTSLPKRSKIFRILMLAICMSVAMSALGSSAYADESTSSTQTLRVQPSSTQSNSRERGVSTKKYSVTKRVKSKNPNRCVYIKLSGKIRSKYAWYTQRPSGIIYSLSKTRLINPTMKVGIAASCNTAKHKKVSKITIRQTWSYQKCSFNASLSVNYPPWGIGFAPTVSCGKTRAALRTTTYTTKGSVFSQGNSKYPVKMPKVIRSTSICMEGTATVTLWTGKSSDTVKLNGFNVCNKP